jgi:hypothetical protein
VIASGICGIDFDNTLVTYDELLAKIASERGLLDCRAADTKKSIRDRMRRLPNGEIEWQKCQALLYGPRIGEAKLIPGVQRFFKLARLRGLRIYVVSHKTEFSSFDTTGVSLRERALAWMAGNRFFEPDGLDLTPSDVFFANTRQQKIEYIARLRCTHFIDDLEETFLDDTFPVDTVRVLYEPARQTAAPAGIQLMRTWQQINDYFFGTH